MTVVNENYRNDYAGNGTTVEFAVTFKFLINSDVKAVLYNSVTEVETELTETTHYTLAGAGVATGGTLTMVIAPASDETLTFVRNLSFLQGTDYVEHSKFPAESHETALDRLTMMAQQLQETLVRSIKQSISQAGELELPAPISEFFLRWTASGNLENYDIADLSAYSVSPFMATVLDAIDDSAARATLGVDDTYITRAQITPDKTISISELTVFFVADRVDYAGNFDVDLGTGGAYETTAMSSGKYNKILFTLNSSGTLLAHEGIEHSTPSGVVEPTLPTNEFPICLVLVQDNGSEGVGTILDITQSAIFQIPRKYSVNSNFYYPDYAEADHGATGNGRTIKIYVDAIGSHDTTIVLRHNSGAATTTYTLTTSITIPDNITVETEPGAILNGAGTITFEKDPEAGLCQIFGSSITVSGINNLYPEWWGAVADGSTDDSTAINSTFTAAETVLKSIVNFTNPSGYGIASAVVCGKNINIKMDGKIIYTGSSDITALTIGETGIDNSLVELDLQVSRENQSDWSSINNIGIKLINIYSSKVSIRRADNFTIGVKQLSENAGSAYNTFFLTRLINNKYGLELRAGEGGWVNENLYIGGRFGVLSTINNTEDRYGIWLVSDSDASGGDYYYNNNNLFIKPSLEMGSSFTSGEAIGVLLDYGTINTFIQPRNEELDKLTIIGNDSSHNYFKGGYSVSGIEDNSTYKNNFYVSGRSVPTHADRGSIIFSSGSFHKNAIYADGSTSINITNVNMGTSSNKNLSKRISGVTITDNYISIGSTRTIGIFVDTSIKKKFVFRPDSDAGYGGRLIIRAYDSNHNVLTSVGGGHPYVLSQAFVTIVWNASYGGVYRTGVDNDNDIFFTVGDNVAYINVMVSGGTSALHSRGFSIFSVNGGNPASWVGFEEIVSGVNQGSTVPIAGTQTIGRRLLNSIPTVGQPKAWICTVSGTFSTATEAGTSTNGSPTITALADTSDFEVGQYVDASAGFAVLTGLKILSIVDNTSITVDRDANATGACTLSTTNPTWVSEGNL